MPSPFMFSEAALMFCRDVAARRRMQCRSGEEFVAMANMHGVDPAQLNPSVLLAAQQRCAQCARRKACRRWLRTGEFQYSGDPRCPNLPLLQNWTRAPSTVA